MIVSKASPHSRLILQCLLCLVLVVAAGSALAADAETALEDAVQPAICLDLPVPEAAAMAGCTSQPCSSWEECLENGCTGSGRCDAGGCLPDSGFVSAPADLPGSANEAWAATVQCETFEDCAGICTGAGRCEKNHCLCLEI